MKKLLLSASVLVCLANAGHAMDDAERARQMALYNTQANGGAQITTTTTTAPIPMPMAAAPAYIPSNPLPAGAPTITASHTAVSRSMPVNDTAPMMATTQQTTVTTTAMAPAPMLPATAAPTPVATTRQMSPLHDDGSPMNVAPDARTLGQTTTRGMQYASMNASGNAGASEHERQMLAWRTWKSANNGAGAATPAPYIPPQMYPPAAVAPAPQPAPAMMPAPMAAPAIAPAPAAYTPIPTPNYAGTNAMPAAPQTAMAQPAMQQPQTMPAPMIEPAAMGNPAPMPSMPVARGPRERTPAFNAARDYMSTTPASGGFND